ncbi:hypothetical protein [Sphingomonas sp. 35-24ZXX]|uniref:hypothetical protein n=1 Tax=Sphingomonas sp. 35-24ZXX TaxID=1545915 RepID=UPI0018CFD63E|nr:hypothetical protein [Sphingomonas sp. 35-24ZXX]
MYVSSYDLFACSESRMSARPIPSVLQEFVMRIAFNLAAAFVSSAVIMLAVI